MNDPVNIGLAIAMGKKLGGGGDEPSGTKEISITENGTTTENVKAYATAEITVDVPNTYTAGDEGKVVSNGALVSQSSSSVTQNGTVDTTLISSLTVAVESGADLAALDVYVADFLSDPPSIAMGTLDVAQRCVYGV